MFEFCLSGSDVAFRNGGHMIWQMQLARRQDAASLTRDYLAVKGVPGGSEAWQFDVQPTGGERDGGRLLV